jgi:histidine triad (HIT) family protein
MGCVFCAIVTGEVEAAVVRRTEDVVVFLDRRPLFIGHCLVVPTTHHPTLADLPPNTLGQYFGVVQEVARALPVALEAEGTFVAMNNVISQSVPHLHTHVVPRRRKDGLRGFFWPRKKYAGGLEEMRDVAARIAHALPRG